MPSPSRLTDPKPGAMGGTYSLPDIHSHNHRLHGQGGLMADEAGELLRSFFRARRVREEERTDG